MIGNDVNAQGPGGLNNSYTQSEYENGEPTRTLITNGFIRDELATIPSATPYQRGIGGANSYASSISSNRSNHLEDQLVRANE